jgi:archaellum biogenesis protein FlaJ (TadC family)
MNSPRFSIPLVTAAMVVFTILCNSHIDLSSEFLVGFLALLHIGLVWMVITILREDKPVNSMNDRIYNDVDIKQS